MISTKLTRVTPIYSFAKCMMFLACLAMIAKPVVHAQVMSSHSEDGWVWLCTSQGLKYVNLNADDTEKSSNQAKQHSDGSCCLYDDEAESQAGLVSQDSFVGQSNIFFFYTFLRRHSFLFRHTRAPPFYRS